MAINYQTRCCFLLKSIIREINKRTEPTIIQLSQLTDFHARSNKWRLIWTKNDKIWVETWPIKPISKIFPQDPIVFFFFVLSQDPIVIASSVNYSITSAIPYRSQIISMQRYTHMQTESTFAQKITCFYSMSTVKIDTTIQNQVII